MRGEAVCILLAFVLGSATTLADTESETDFTVLCQALDPEIHHGPAVMVWQDLSVSPNRAKTVGLIWSSGLLKEDQFVVGEDVTDYFHTQAGPKFAEGSDGTYIVYTKDEVGSRHIAHFRLVPPVQGSCVPADYPAGCFTDGGTIVPAPTQEYYTVYSTEDEDFTFSNAMVVYKWRDQDSPANTELRWRGIMGTPSEENFANSSAPFGRIQNIKDENGENHLFNVTTVSTGDDGDGVDEQVAIMSATDTDPTVEIITTGDGKRFNPFIWFDTTRGRNMMVLRFDPALGGGKHIEVWREATLGAGDWELFRTYTHSDMGDPLLYLLSPEPFMWRGKSYLLFSSSNTEGVNDQTDANIWIAEVKASGTFYKKRVNDRPAGAEARSRFEAEVFFKQGPPVIFFNYQRLPGETACSFLDQLPDPLPADHIRQTTIRRGESGLN